jgi:hypothetical protein
MSKINSFNDINNLVSAARSSFSANKSTQKEDIELVTTTLLDAFQSITKIYSPEEWSDSRHEMVVIVLMQCFEGVFANYFLSESGYWENASVLQRNYIELLSISIAIGYDNSLYIDWVHERDNMKSFRKIMKSLKESNHVPETKREILTYMDKQWARLSQNYSHNLSKKSLRTKVVEGKINLEPRVVTVEFQKKRITKCRNMLVNILSVLLGVFDYGKVAESRKSDFPEALGIIGRSNEILNNLVWKNQKTA